MHIIESTINTRELEDIFVAIGLANELGEHRYARARKYRQVFDFIEHIAKAVKRMTSKRTLILLDCACGKSYLSFIANYYCTEILKRKVRIIGIDYNQIVIEKSQIAAKKLHMDNMSFVCSDIMQYKLPVDPDIVYSLHACDTATDMTIAKGIITNARYIMTVSCCQHTSHTQIKKHPLGPVTRYGVYKERVVDMVTDAMRSLLLENQGYNVSLFDYVPASETPKNVMLRAEKGSVKQKRVAIALNEYQQLHNTFNIKPKLHDYIDHMIIE